MLGVAVAVRVARYERVSQIELVSFDGDETAFETGVAGFHGFYFRAGQYQTGLVMFPEGIIKTGSFVYRYDWHNL